ncbi:retention module-containing protein [Oxalobacter formigenes]
MAIGIVRALVGTTTATDSRGNTRVLRVGDAVELNETIQSSAGSTVLIQFDNGGFATVGSNDKLVLDQSVLDPTGNTRTAEAAGQSVEDIQAMIAAGMDPTQIAEATAAGADAGTAGDPGHSGSHSFVVVNQEGASAEVTPGFGTDTSASPLDTAAAQTAEPRFFINPDTAGEEAANNAPTIIDRHGDTLNLKEAGVGTVEQGGKPGWALGDHNHAIAGTPKAGGSFTVSDADGDELSARLVDGSGNPVEGVVTDPDTGVMTLETEYGTLTVTPTVNPDGSVTYDYSFELNDNANSLNEGQSADYEYKVEVSDGRGGTVSEDVHVKIDGTNDAPSIKFDSVHVKEEGAGTSGIGGNDGFVGDNHHRFVVHGDLSQKAGDVDAGDNLTYSVDIKGGEKNLETASTGGSVVTDAEGNKVSVPVEVLSNTTENGIQTIVTNYGTFTLNTATGEYTFELNTAEGSPANNLAQGEFLNLGFTSTVTDLSGAIGNHTVRVTVEGSNDAPVLSKPDAVDVYQGGNDHSVEGQVIGSDADHGAKLSYSFGVDGNGNPVTEIETSYGTVRINPDTGEYEYTLKPGASTGDLTDEFNVRVTDEHGAYDEKNVSVNIHGNRAPEIVTPPEDADGLVVKESGQAAKGEGVPDKGWAEGENQTKVPGIKSDGDSFTVKDPDGGDKLKATLTDEHGNPVEGVITNQETGVITLVTDYGTLTVTPTVNGDGSVTYDYQFVLNDNGKANNLAQGEEVPLDFYIKVSDSSGAFVTQEVNVTIEGTNDGPKVNGTQVHVKEEGVYDGNQDTSGDGKNNGNMNEQYHRTVVEGKVPFSDPDDGSVIKLSADLSDGKKVVSETTAAVFKGDTLTPDNGTGATEKIVIENRDSYTKTVDGKEHTIEVIQTNYGTLELDTVTGNYTFTLNGEAADHLAAGEKFIIDFRVTATDEHNAQGHSDFAVHVTVEGANDAPSFVQLEHNDYLGIEQPSIGADGKWEVEAAEQGRWRGNDGNTNRVSDHSDVVSGSFGASDDDRGSTLTFSADFVNGTTSGPNKDALEQGNQGNGLKPTGVDDLTLTAPKVLAEHADKGSDHYTELPAGTYKVFHFDVGDFYLDVNTGKYYFDVKDGNPMIDGMNLGDSHSLNFNVTVTDEHGASSSHDFTINITGRNDRPELTVSDTPLGVTAGSDVHGNLLGDNILSVADDDINDTHTFHIITNPTMNGNNPGDYDGRTDNFASNRFENYKPVTQLEGKYGVLTIDPDTGDYTYRLYGKGEGPEGAWELVQGLGKDGVLTDEVFHIGVKDSHNAFDIKDIHITVNGNESAPSVDPVDASLVVNEAGLNNPVDGSEVAVLKLADGYEIVESADGHYGEGMYGKLVQNGEGQWEYRLEKAYDHAPDQNTAGTASGADTITIQVKGPDGQIQNVTVKVDIIDDVPQISAGDNNAVAGVDGSTVFEGALTIDYGADGASDSFTDTGIHVRVDGIDFVFKAGSNGELAPLDVVAGTLTLTGGKDGHFDYTFKPAPGYEDKPLEIELSVKDHDGDTATGTIVIDPSSTPPVPENHAPVAGDASADVTVSTETITVPTDGNRIVAGGLTNDGTSASINGVDRYEGDHGNHSIFKDHNGGVSYEEAIRGSEKVSTLADYLKLIEGENCPDVIVIDNAKGNFVFDGSFNIPEGKTVIVDGDCVIGNGAHFNNSGGQHDAFGGLFYVTGDMIIEKGSFHPGSGPHILVQGNFDWHGNVQVSGALETTVTIEQTEVRIDLNETFTDAEKDTMTFQVDKNSLPDGYDASITNGVLTIAGKEGVPFGQHGFTVTATDEKGASTTIIFDISVSGGNATVEVLPVNVPGSVSFDPMMLSAMSETGAGHVTDDLAHQPLDGNPHTDTVDGMIAAADTVEHGTAGHDMLTGSHGNDVLYGEAGHDLMVGDGSGTTVDALAGLVHSDSSSESVLNTIHAMSPEQLKGLSDGLETMEHHNDGNDVLLGGAGNDVLIGMGGNDVLHGGEGNDILLGGSGDDILVGGKGDDVLAGGSGHDTFQYHQGDLDGVVNGDHIADFHLGDQATDPNADVLDIGDLLLGSGAKADGSDLFSGGFLQVEVISHDEEKGTAKVRLSIDQDGAAGSEHGSVALATIDMKGVHGIGGMNAQDQADHLMQQLMDNHALKM